MNTWRVYDGSYGISSFDSEGASLGTFATTARSSHLEWTVAPYQPIRWDSRFTSYMSCRIKRTNLAVEFRQASAKPDLAPRLYIGIYSGHNGHSSHNEVQVYVALHSLGPHTAARFWFRLLLGFSFGVLQKSLL